MDVTCEQCNVKFKIPDEKIPKGQLFSVACPKCKHKIPIDTREKPPQDVSEIPPPPSVEAGSSPLKGLIDQVSASSYDADEKPFDFVEEGVETALLCESDPDRKVTIRDILEGTGYKVTEPNTSVEALKRMRFHIFDLVVLNERFDTDDPDECNVLKYLEHLSMEIRRKTYVALITDRFRTMDNMAAFNKSVNLVINIKNIEEFNKILDRGVADNASFYRVYREAMVSTGRY